ncbi:c-type cytochrome [Billgrantia lactosivorans]|uniref:c-type cytochrome n=1 Tax=Billgrantia lactosivorans TaxID=2185141 RepID=UPI000DAECECD|nr:c-type cytochrome [Halomonas lactosivorans]
MSKTVNDPQRSPRSIIIGLRRMLKAAALGLILFAFGTLLYQSGLVEKAYNALGKQSDTAQGSSTRDAMESRQAMQAEREAWLANVTAEPPQVPTGPDGYFVPPEEDELPEGPFGESVRRGHDIFVNTPRYAAQYSGNSQSCVNCHLDAGRKENSAPLWGAYTKYPMYRGKNGMVNTYQERIKGCFTFSMNAQASAAGGPPPLGDQVYLDLEAYAYWLASGAPTGQTLPGAGYPNVAKTELGYDYERGADVFVENCALCHGEDGQGRHEDDGSVRFPPLWGPEAYNWGAGMARIDTAASFIKYNMPLGQGQTLTDQEAWDVAAYINSFERPKDPRQTGTLEEARQTYHENEQSYYGKEVRGSILGLGVSREQTAAQGG